MLKNSIKFFFVHFGLLRVIEKIILRYSGPKILILFGHRVLPDDIIYNENDPRKISGHTSTSEIEKVIQVYSKSHKFISIDEAAHQIDNNSINHNSIVLSFDDGFEDNYKYLLPILKKYDVPAIFYVNTSIIGTDKSLWFQGIINFFNSLDGNSIYVEINNQDYDISSPQSKFKSAFHLMRYLQANHDPNDFLSIIQSLAGDKCKPSLMDKHMTWEQLKKMVDEPLITIGAHSVNHFPLALCKPTLAKKEIIESILKLEDKLKISIKHFSYPRGTKDDYNNYHVEILKENNIFSAVTTTEGLNDSDSSLYKLKRYGLPKKVVDNMASLIWSTSGVHQLLKNLKSIFFNKKVA